jgi:hypothetical protein
MINELFSLSKTLNNEGITVINWHKDYQPLRKVSPKYPCIRIWLDDDGSVCSLESISQELALQVRSFGNNHGKFPAFNINALYRLTDDTERKMLTAYKKGNAQFDATLIQKWFRENNWIKDMPRKALRSMQDQPKKLMEMIRPETLDNTIMGRLIELSGLLCEQPGGLRASLEKHLCRMLERGEDIDIALLMLFHEGDPRKQHGKDVGDSISIVLDVKNWKSFGHPVVNQRTTEQINKLLITGSQKTIAKHSLSDLTLDAFGSPAPVLGQPMPKVDLPNFPVILRSMFNGQPCQKRYGRIDDGSFPISQKHRDAVKSSLEWISDASHQQVTWVKADSDEIVFVYPSTLPEVPVQFASFFNSAATSEASRARFEDIAADFSRVYQGTMPHLVHDSIRVFAVKKVGKGRSKIVYSHQTTPEYLIEAAKQWSNGFHNTPELVVGRCETPFPLELPEIANPVWKSDGSRADGKQPARAMRRYDGMALLLDTFPPGLLRNLLRACLNSGSGLIKHMGSYLYRDRKNVVSTNSSTNQRLKSHTAKLLALYGFQLFKSGIRKEEYMEELAFLLGQFLHVADEMHAFYCIVNRDGSVPPQLVGNALLITAGDSPMQAFAQLSTRMAPYIGWARHYQYKNNNIQNRESWRAKWLLRLFEQLSDKIQPQIRRELRFDDYQKAELFLGYMSSLPRTSKEEVSIENNNVITQEENNG